MESEPSDERRLDGSTGDPPGPSDEDRSMDPQLALGPPDPDAATRADARWLDTWMEWSVWAGAALGGPLAAWMPVFLRDHFADASGEPYGLWSTDVAQRFLGGVLFGALAALALACLGRVAVQSWRALVRE